MAIVRHLEEQQLQIEASHTETECTYSLVKDKDGTRYLQIDTYGSSERKIEGKKSQSIRFSPDAVAELKRGSSEGTSPTSPCPNRTYHNLHSLAGEP
jgi:hypothetical protein